MLRRLLFSLLEEARSVAGPGLTRQRLGRLLKEHGRDRVLRLLAGGGVGVEIGVHEGDLSARILRRVRPACLHLVDPWRYEPDPLYADSLYGGPAGQSQVHMDRRYQGVLRRFAAEIARGQVQVHRETSQQAARRFEAKSLDWVYVDGNHLFEHVRQDIELYLPRLRPGGLLAGDDYVQGRWWQGGVKRAVDEALARGVVEPVLLQRDQFVLRRPA